MVGLTIVAFYGTDLRDATIGIVLGNVTGFSVLGVLATMGPRYGVPQMVAGRLAFGRFGNIAPATLSFLAGVGWFAINTVFGAYALQSIAGWPYPLALATMIALQIVLAVYGYNLIHLFERASVMLLALGFLTLAAVTFPRAQWFGTFNGHALSAGGGPTAAFIFAGALAFSYALGWVPCASDYSRYLPRSTNPRSVWWYSFAGCVLSCVVLEVMGAAAVTAVRGVDFTSTLPTQAVSTLLGSGWLAKLVLAAVVLGTLTANCMNLYSGALAALVAFNVRTKRALAALAVGIIGALLATGGGKPAQMAIAYTDFLLLLSYWASPWAGAVLVDFWLRGATPSDPERVPHWSAGFAAWLIGLLASAPFWNQAWFAGPIARTYPQLGDLSYYVGFVVSGASMYLLSRFRVARVAAAK